MLNKIIDYKPECVLLIIIINYTCKYTVSFIKNVVAYLKSRRHCSRAFVQLFFSRPLLELPNFYTWLEVVKLVFQTFTCHVGILAL